MDSDKVFFQEDSSDPYMANTVPLPPTPGSHFQKSLKKNLKQINEKITSNFPKFTVIFYVICILSILLIGYLVYFGDTKTLERAYPWLQVLSICGFLVLIYTFIVRCLSYSKQALKS
ncbi:hypothetical protein DLEV_073 [Diachasmimorpha longicaudata entomopoxvirus]|uniref:Uncharacterized protein n=1 Tax=Diachasmimorpha longicaudata entomopoxvirus TaxID=109981 RepID=A0A7R5WMG1_9POXV|nr:hypothetical protein QKK69_gp073 [Diachasmimorpha longicaudata entomopoxvirus]AKS26364.1 hypothetical protein DLEV_073 [Diachasmimorpha longicaudata entomopoxvirus]